MNMIVKNNCRKRSRTPQKFTLPLEIEDLKNKNIPLYMLVALWSFRKNELVTVRSVSIAFEISIRRASDLLEYLTEQGEEHVIAECVVSPLRHGDKRMRRTWRVTDIISIRYYKL
ncbi:CaiF/GrlA family transcriptional regulator [Enterobacter kobei]|jgi:hypothetical protein|uniref:CaiF/GrlA family transcriptional regulator n=1 Tax=Enterobacter kobei TaxID=208224 RepID=UPI0023798029|nr:CaiF/GrlA family transcriptional regulator [Enterobacter kobei]MDD9221875.1 CaiF/GrlA family transcriptional regulator [Enterobacter kobei]